MYVVLVLSSRLANSRIVVQHWIEHVELSLIIHLLVSFYIDWKDNNKEDKWFKLNVMSRNRNRFSSLENYINIDNFHTNLQHQQRRTSQDRILGYTCNIYEHWPQRYENHANYWEQLRGSKEGILANSGAALVGSAVRHKHIH